MYLKSEYHCSRRLSDARRDAWLLQELLALFSGSARAQGELLMWWRAGEWGNHEKCSVLSSTWTESEKPKIHHKIMLAPLGKLRDSLGRTVSQWFQLDRECPDAINLLLNVNFAVASLGTL